MKKNNFNMAFRFLICVIFSFSIMFHSGNKIYAGEDKLDVIYFAVPLCSSCAKFDEALEQLDTKKLNIKKFNVNEVQNYAVYLEYNDYCHVKEDNRHTPVIFVSDNIITEHENIAPVIEGILAQDTYNNTPDLLEYQETNDLSDQNISDKISNYNILTVCLNGFINGFNPCSLSMLLFFLVLANTKEKDHIKRFGFSFVFGKFITYLLIGTIVYQYLSMINFNKYNLLIKTIFVCFMLVLIFLNLMDYYNIKREKMGLIKNQLPKGLRKLNHNVIKALINHNSGWILLLVCFFIGVLISIGEFLCSGQIYLATLSFIINQHQATGTIAFLYLILYVSCFLIPSILIILLLSRGKDALSISKVVNEKLHLIKLFSAIVLIILTVFILVWM